MKRKRFSTVFLAVILTAAMSIPLLTGCAGGGSDVPDNFVAETSGEYGTLQWEYYKDPEGNFAVEIPVGWKVNMKKVNNLLGQEPSRLVEIKNPDETMGVWGIDYMYFYASQLSSLTVEAVFKEQIFSPSQNSSVTSYELTGEKIITDSMNAFKNSEKSEHIKDIGRYREHFVQKGMEGEGEVECALVSHDSASFIVSALLVKTAYATPMGVFDKWQPVLDRIRESLNFTYNNQGQGGTANNGGTGTVIPDNGTVYNPGTFDLSDSITSRNNVNDINVQKFDDYILGRDRVQDNSTGDIYYADQSWYDQYSDWGGERYSQISGDQYLSDVSGEVGW